MVKGGVQQAQNLPADLTQVIDQLERHCLAPDASLVSKSAYYDLQLVRLLPHCKNQCVKSKSLSVVVGAGKGGNVQGETALLGSNGNCD